MNVLKLFYLLVIALLIPIASIAKPPQLLPKEICKDLGIKTCNVSEVDAFSEVDLNGDGKNEIIFGYDGGSCGEQHWVYLKNDSKWLKIGNWCGMDGGAYKVLSSKHNGFFDIDTLFGVIRFDGKQYTRRTQK